MFEGYTDKTSTKKKIARSILRDGDEWFTSGDLLRKDRWGFFYWVDRVGDTFRWKGENVSTAEVQEAFPGWDVNVYGVEVPGYEGRAGMARIVGRDLWDENGFYKIYKMLEQQLPRYAIPLFLRTGSEVKGEDVMTSTFKHKKNELVKEGFDPSCCWGETVYWRDDSKRTFVRMTKQDYDHICAGKIRV